jgi:hypothetical protein
MFDLDRDKLVAPWGQTALQTHLHRSHPDNLGRSLPETASNDAAGGTFVRFVSRWKGGWCAGGVQDGPLGRKLANNSDAKGPVMLSTAVMRGACLVEHYRVPPECAAEGCHLPLACVKMRQAGVRKNRKEAQVIEGTGFL